MKLGVDGTNSASDVNDHIVAEEKINIILEEEVTFNYHFTYILTKLLPYFTLIEDTRVRI
jgi:hypothetical protein